MGVLIAYLLGVLTAVRSKNQEGKRVDSGNRKSHSSFPDRDVAIESVLPTSTDQGPSGQENKRTRKTINWVERTGLVVLSIYTAFTGYQAYEMRKATNATVHFFHTDERAWIELEPVKPILFAPKSNDIPREIFRYELYPRNVGKTPARDVVMRAQVSGAGEIFGNDASMIENWQEKFLLSKFTDSNTGKPINITGVPIPRVLAPNTVAPVPYLLHGQEPQYFRDGNGFYDYLVGRIDYVDQFNVKHWMKFCFFVVNQR